MKRGARSLLPPAVIALLSSCSAGSPAPPPADEHPEFDFLLRASADSASARPAPPALLSARSPANVSSSVSAVGADDPYAGCRPKMGTSLATQLKPGLSTMVKVTVEFFSPKDDDEVPGLGFVRPAVAVGSLTPWAIAKLCDHPDLKWIDATPTFMGAP
jgi:hypothetical protein